MQYLYENKAEYDSIESKTGIKIFPFIQGFDRDILKYSYVWEDEKKDYYADMTFSISIKITNQIL
jgi:hypothetical protein